MCGKNKDCGCNSATRAEHAARETVITASMVAAADEALSDESYSPPERFDCVLTVEGLRTADRRHIQPKALSWRTLPWNVMAQFQNDGHRGAQIVGNIEKITREPYDAVDGAYLIKGNGFFDLDDQFGRRAATMVDKQTLRFGSIDLQALKGELIILGEDGEPKEDASIWDLFFGSDEELDYYESFSVGRIMGWTMVPMPAFPQAVVVPEGASLNIPKPFKSKHHPAKPILASGVTLPDEIPQSWFADPELPDVTPLTITDDGHIYGHLALWGTCHIGVSDRCVTPPESQSDYAYFKTGSIQVMGDDGQLTTEKIGHITFDTGHASTTDSWKETVSHYDDTGTVAADVSVGEDEFGIWFSGAMRTTLSDEDVRTVRAAPLSGDWRTIGGDMELVAALAVNVPGFPIVAAGLIDDQQVSLIAAAPRQVDKGKQLEARVQRLEAILLAEARPSMVASLSERVNGPKKGSRKDFVRQLSERVNASAEIKSIRHFGATGSKSLPLADEGTKWNGPGAAKRMKKEDGDEKPGSATKKGHAWSDSKGGDKFESYKLPFADIIDGKLTAVPKGVEAAAAAIQGSRGGVNIPEEDVPAVKKLLGAYYSKMGKTPPWEDEKKSDDKGKQKKAS